MTTDDQFRLIPESSLDRLILSTLARRLADEEFLLVSGSADVSGLVPAGLIDRDGADEATDLLNVALPEAVAVGVFLMSEACGPEASMDWAAARLEIRVRPEDSPEGPDVTGRDWWMRPAGAAGRLARARHASGG